MKFSINRQVFLKTLTDVQRAISSKTTIPILTGLKMVLSNDGLTLTGSNTDISIETTLLAADEKNQLTIQETGAIVLPRIFNDVVKKLPETIMTIEVTENFQTVIKSGQSEFKINGLDANTYPPLPEIQAQKPLQLPADILKQIINQTVFAVSNQESRPILTGVHLTLKDKQLLAVATDSHRLAQRQIAVSVDDDMQVDVTIPGKSLMELARSIADDTENIEIRIAENQVLFTADALAFYTRLLEGNYPDTTRLIPTESTTSIEFEATQLLAAIERASLLSHESRNNVVRLTLDDAKKTAVIYGNSPDVGNVEEAINFEKMTGDALEISFNPDYLKDALRSLGPTNIIVDFTSALRPFTIKPTEDQTTYIQLITPVRTF